MRGRKSGFELIFFRAQNVQKPQTCAQLRPWWPPPPHPPLLFPTVFSRSASKRFRGITSRLSAQSQTISTHKSRCCCCCCLCFLILWPRTLQLPTEALHHRWYASERVRARGNTLQGRWSRKYSFHQISFQRAPGLLHARPLTQECSKSSHRPRLKSYIPAPPPPVNALRLLFLAFTCTLVYRVLLFENVSLTSSRHPCSPFSLA